jgi:hypothetical protein
MSPAEAGRLIETAKRGLTVDRANLLKGDVAAVARAAEARAAALQAVTALDAEGLRALAPQLEALGEATRRQMGLLEAARDGARRARHKLEAMLDARDRVPGYDASGAPRAAAPGKNLTSRRV